MIRKFLILLTTLILSWNCFSENAIAQTKDTTQIVLSTEVARMVVQDLVEGDKTKEESKIFREQIGIQKEIISTQDSLILNLNQNLTLESLRCQDLENQIRNNLLEEEKLKGRVRANRICAITLGGTSIVLTGVLVLFLVRGMK